METNIKGNLVARRVVCWLFCNFPSHERARDGRVAGSILCCVLPHHSQVQVLSYGMTSCVRYTLLDPACSSCQSNHRHFPTLATNRARQQRPPSQPPLKSASRVLSKRRVLPGWCGCSLSREGCDENLMMMMEVMKTTRPPQQMTEIHTHNTH